MKKWLLILAVTSILSCDSPGSDKNKKPEPVTTQTIPPTDPPKVNEPFVEDDEQYDTTFLQVDGKRFILLTGNERFLGFLSAAGDKLIPAGDYDYPEITDINEDGYNDLRLFSDGSNDCENYFYNKGTGKFNRIANAGFDIKKISGTPYYYSYESDLSCENNIWKSILSRLDKDSLINIGSMEANGCDNYQEFDRLIKTYRIKGEKEKLVDRLFYVKLITPLTDKWSFIEKYWTKNYKRFE